MKGRVSQSCHSDDIDPWLKKSKKTFTSHLSDLGHVNENKV